MIAQIVPLVKMPRRFAFFDYKIPNNLCIHIGDLVEIPLKGRNVTGIVRGKQEKSAFKRLVEIKKIIHSRYISKQDIKRLECIAEHIIQSPSTLFSSALHGAMYSRIEEQHALQKCSGSFSKADASIIQLIAEKNPDCLETSIEGAIAAIIQLAKTCKKQLLILCPREQDVQIISSFIKQPHARLHGHTPLAKRRWAIENWKDGNILILIGTRQACLLPAHNLDVIALFDPHSEDHVSYKKNPRYDARLAAKLLAKQHKAKIIKLSPLAQLCDKHIVQTPKQKAIIVDLHDKREYSGIPLLSETLLLATRNALQNRQSVLFSYNAKGFAKRLQCKSCHHIPLCGNCGSQPAVRQNDLICPVCKTEMWTPKQCPACQKPKLSTRGIGNKRIASELKKQFPNALINLVDKEHSKTSKADIVIGTEHFFQSMYFPFPEKRFGLIAEIMAEKSLANHYNDSVITAYRLARLEHMAHYHKAKLIIQTWMPKMIHPLLDSQKIRRTQLKQREQYQLPPIVDEYILSGKTKEQKMTKTSDRKKMIHQLQKLPDSITIQTHYSSYDPQYCESS